jgi:glycosyltransferase involved in cell wall biosynthesis
LGKIRVLQIVTRLVQRGVPRYVLDVAAGLNPDRYVVEILAGRGDPEEGSRWEEAHERGIKTYSVAALQRAINPLGEAVAFAAIYQKIRKGDYDIVHTHISKAGILGRLAAKCAGVPVIIHTYHGKVEELYDGSFKSRILLACERMAARITDAIVAVSEDTARISLEGGIGSAPQYEVIHNGIDVGHFRNFVMGGGLPVELNGKRLVGAIGSLTEEKGLDVLLRAWPRLLDQYPDLQLCLIGDGPLRSCLQDMARDRVYFTGNLDDVRPWLGEFEVLLLPSRREGLPTVVLEAMAMGRPVVASRIGGVPEVVLDGRTGLLVPPEDPVVLATAVGELLQDASRRQEWGRAGQERVKKEFGLEKMIRKLEQLYEDLLKAKKVER